MFANNYKTLRAIVSHAVKVLFETRCTHLILPAYLLNFRQVFNIFSTKLFSITTSYILLVEHLLLLFFLIRIST